MRFAFIDVEKAFYPMRILCRVLRVSRSGYYAWRTRKPSARQLEDEQLRTRVVEAFKTGRGRYGSPRVRGELVDQGFEIGRKRVARLMRELGLQGVHPRRFRVTTDSDHDHRIANNLLDRNFVASGPNEKWATDPVNASADVTRDQTADACLPPSQLLPLEVLRRPIESTQYASDRYREALDARGITCSMSRRADCWDSEILQRCHRLAA
jgi:transposase InsO family protein